MGQNGKSGFRNIYKIGGLIFIAASCGFLIFFAASAHAIGIDPNSDWGLSRVGLVVIGITGFFLSNLSLFIRTKRQYGGTFRRAAFYQAALLILFVSGGFWLGFQKVRESSPGGLFWLAERYPTDSIVYINDEIIEMDISGGSLPAVNKMSPVLFLDEVPMVFQDSARMEDLQKGEFQIDKGMIRFRLMLQEISPDSGLVLRYAPLRILEPFASTLLFLSMAALLFLLFQFNKDTGVLTSLPGFIRARRKPVLVFGWLQFIVFFWFFITTVVHFQFIDRSWFLICFGCLLSMLLLTEKTFMDRLLPTGLIILLFSFSLLSLWQGDRLTQYAIGGLLPRNDALGFFADFEEILEDNPVTYSAWSNRLPANLFWTALYGLSGHNLQATLMIMTILIGITAAWLMFCIRRTFGIIPASFALISIFGYFNLYICSGTVLSENIGLLLGMCGAGILIRSWPERKTKELIFGFFVLSLAVLTRPGTNPVLVFVAMLIIWRIRPVKKSVVPIVFMLSMILLESGWNAALNAYFSKGAEYTNQTGSELYMIGWGLLTGKDPTAFRTIYPDQIPDADTIRTAWETFKVNPKPAFSYLKEIWLNTFSADNRVLSQFRNYEFLKQINFWCLIVGLIVTVRKRKKAEFLLLFGVWLVITIQAPLLHYIIARLVSPVYSLLCIIPGIGLQALISTIIRADRESGEADAVPVISKAPAHSFLILPGLVCVLILISPVVVIMLREKPATVETVHQCPEGQSFLSVKKPDNGSYIHIVDRDRAASDPEKLYRLPEMSLDGFLHNEILGFDDRLFSAKAGSVLFIRNKTFLLAPDSVLSSDEPVLNLCGTRWGTYQFLFEAAEFPGD